MSEATSRTGSRSSWWGRKCNRTAIGARVRVVTGKHIQMDEVSSGTSVMSQNDLRLHFGLGNVETVDVIEVKWPTTQKLEKFHQGEGQPDHHDSRRCRDCVDDEIEMKMGKERPSGQLLGGDAGLPEEHHDEKLLDLLALLLDRGSLFFNLVMLLELCAAFSFSPIRS